MDLTEKIKISHVTQNDYNLIKPLVTNYNVMKYVGNQRIWNDERLMKFLKYSETDWNNNKWYQWKVTTNDELIGLISLHLFDKIPNIKDEYFLTVFINKKFQGKGYLKIILKNVIKEFRTLQPIKKEIYALTLKNNLIAQKSFIKNKFKKINGHIKLNNNKYILYKLEL